MNIGGTTLKESVVVRTVLIDQGKVSGPVIFRQKSVSAIGNIIRVWINSSVKLFGFSFDPGLHIKTNK